MRPFIAILPYDPLHATMLPLRPEQTGDSARFRQAHGAAAEHGPAFTAAEMGPEGRITRVLGCAGLIENSSDYATAWAMFAEGLRPAEWAVLTAAIRGVLAASDYRRIDMIVRADFEAGHRFAAHLGFAPDAIVHARVSRETAPQLEEAA